MNLIKDIIAISILAILTVIGITLEVVSRGFEKILELIKVSTKNSKIISDTEN